jgi:Spy/CpxP family protein refolding chaperone
MTSIASRMGILAALFLTAGATGGCGGSAGQQPPASAASAPADDVAAGLMEHHRYHHHGGLTLFIAMSLDTLGIPPEERVTVEKIRADLHTRMEPARVAEQSLLTSLADGVAAGSIDAAAVDAGVARVVAAAEAVHDASVDALNQLHGVLSPPERAALVDKVEAHWAVWQKANPDETGAGQADRTDLGRLTADLELRSDQVDTIRANLGTGMKDLPKIDAPEVEAHLRAFDAAFRSDSFDAKALPAGGRANAHLVGWGAARMARVVESISPVLTPDQRTALAERLREHASHEPSVHPENH